MLLRLAILLAGIAYIQACMKGSDIVLDRDNFIKLFLVAPISKYSILFGKALSLLITSSMFFLSLGMFFLILNNEFSIVKSLVILAYFVSLIIISVAAGLFLSALSQDRKASERIIGFAGFALLFLSGILFPISLFPAWAQVLFKANPLVYFIDLFRFFITGVGELPLVTDAVAVLFSGVLIVFLGIYQFDRKLRK